MTSPLRIRPYEGRTVAVGTLHGKQRQFAPAFARWHGMSACATSALDTESELAVQAGLERLMVGRTVLAVAHRLSTIAEFDRVLVVERGRIVEDGAPQHLLMREDGEFRRLWTMQAQGLELDDKPQPRLRLIGGNAVMGLNDRVQAAWRRAQGKG